MPISKHNSSAFRYGKQILGAAVAFNGVSTKSCSPQAIRTAAASIGETLRT